MKSLTKYTSVWSTRLLEITQSCSPLDRGALLSSRADVDTFGQWLFFSRENQNLSREKTQNFAREKLEKLAWNFFPENLPKKK